MSKNMASALGIGLACMIWALVSSLTDLPTWMGFVGCVGYFAAGGGKSGGIRALGSVWTGIFWAMVVIMLFGVDFMQDKNTALFVGALAVGFISWAIPYQSKIGLLSNVPVTFMGCFSTFASGGDWKILLLCATIGVALGFACDYSGRFLFQLAGGRAATAPESKA